MISAKVWDKLSDGDKRSFRKRSTSRPQLSIRTQRPMTKNISNLMRKKGIKVHTYTTEQLRPLMDAFAATWGQLDQSKGKELMDEFRKEMKRISDSTK